jgi:hypothetical protein
MTIEVPTPSADLIAQIETATIETNEIATAAVASIRAKFSAYAKHNGWIKTGWESQCDSNFRWSLDAYYRAHGATVRTRGLLCSDDFGTENARGDQNRGSFTGSRLYLTNDGEWLQITRDGSWSRWQGEGEGWACGDVDWDENPDESERYESIPARDCAGSVMLLSDEEVARQYKLESLLEELGKTMTTLCEKLPERYGKLKARAELAQRIIDGLKA